MALDAPATDHATPLLGPDSDEQPVLSIVLPTMNEEAGIEETLQTIIDAVDDLDTTAEVIVSDSSTDDTPKIARELGAIVVEPDRLGYGYAYRYAFEQARGEYVVMGDADTTYDFRELPRLIDCLTEQDADLVLGSRFAGEIKAGAMPALHRYVGNPALTAFLNRFYGANVTDAHSGFRVIRRKALAALTLESDGMEFASEMIMEASIRGLTIAEVPITYHPREGEPTLNTFEDGWKHLRFMLLNAPGYLFSAPGIGFFALGMVLMALAFSDITFRLGPDTPVWFGVRTMVVGSLLAIVGYQVASLGTFATIASDPIRRPTDPITTWIVNHLRLEYGLLVGGVLSLVGAGYASTIVLTWLQQGYDALPIITHDILAFTLIILGIQTSFASFFISAVRSSRQ